MESIANTDLSLFREKMKETRKRKNVTLKEIAEAVGVTEATMQRYESGNGIKRISYENIVKISECLNVSPTYLLGWESPVPKVENVDAHIELIRLYDRLTPEQQKAIIQTMRTMAN